MKITEAKLKQIIKEEVVKLLIEQDEYDDYDEEEEEELTYGQKIIRLLSSTDPDTFAQGVSLYSTLKDEIEVNAPTENSQILAKLKVINQFAESGIEDVNSLSVLSELNVTEKIDLSWCKSLQDVDGLKECTKLTRLYLPGCNSLKNVDALQGLTNLTTLDLGLCRSLENVDGLKGCTNLTTLNLGWCRSLPPELRRMFRSNEYDTAYEQFMKALNASKGSQP